MDLGLGNLTQLKAHLLNEALRASSTYDAALAALGRGVAARFEGVCNRKFGRVVGETFETSADRDFVILPRYPLEEVTAVELRESLADGWVDQGTVEDILENINAAAGLVSLGSQLSALNTARLRLTFTGGYWYPTAAARVIQSATVEIAEGAQTAFVAFPTAFDTIPVVGVSLQPPDGEALIDCTPQAVTKSGFTILLAAATAAAGYSVAWVAAEAADDLDAAVLQSGNATLAADDESKAITFGTAFAAAPRVFCNVVAPDGGVLFTVQPALVTASGFTAVFGAAVPATGYSLAWIAVAAGATSAAPTLPAGATALPADLSLAWLNQCALVWQSIDALGLGLSDAKARAASAEALAKLTLAPDVEQTLRRYMRYALT